MKRFLFAAMLMTITLPGLMVPAMAGPRVLRRISTKEYTAPRPYDQNLEDNTGWHPHNKVGLVEGTFLGVKNNNRALIREADGDVVEVPLFHLTARDLGYILNRLAKFPEEVLDVERKPDEKPLLDMTTADLPPGPLETWPNNGALGGAFHSMNTPPVVEEINGRKGVRFGYWPWYIDPQYNAMTADVLAPKSLAEGKPFTLSIWICHPLKPDWDDPEVLMSWHSLGGNHGTSIDWKLSANWGSSYIAGLTGDFDVPDRDVQRAVPEWTHMAYVYTGGLEGALKVYENGLLKHTIRYDRLPELREPTEITATSVTLNGYLNTASNEQAYVATYLGVFDSHYWMQHRHIGLWPKYDRVGWTDPGPFSSTIDGLKPGTRYYYRMLACGDSDYQNYGNTSRRWANGVGSFVTATADGKPGRILPRDYDQHLFLGVHWGSRWYTAYDGPSGWFRGYIGDLKLYDRALNESEIRGESGFAEGSDGPSGATLDGGKPTVTRGAAFEPFPEDGSTVNLLGDFRWKSDGDIKDQRLYLAGNRDAVLAATEPHARVGGRNEFNGIAALKPGRTYYWRVESVQKDETVIPGDVWSFTTKHYFTPEPDGPVSEPYFDEIEPGRPGARVMEGMGHPSISTPGADEGDLWAVTYGTSRFLRKSADLRRQFLAGPWGSTVGTFEGDARVRGFHTGSYGAIPNWLLQLHEMGHQLHNGLNAIAPDFQERLDEVFIARADSNVMLGDYAAVNTGENMAVCSHAFTGSVEREELRRDDPGMYWLLARYMPGDLNVELHPADGLHVDRNDVVTSWANRGGQEETVGTRHTPCRFVKLPETVGAFEGIGDPSLETVAGVTAVQFDGDDALRWNLETLRGFQDNREWSVELWVWCEPGAEEPRTVLGWGPEAEGARLMLGADRVAYRFNAGISGEATGLSLAGGWHHVAWVFEGGGLADGEGALMIYVDGKEIHRAKHKLAIKPNVRMFVGGTVADGQVTNGFRGAVAHVRAYNYDIDHEQVEDHFDQEVAFYRRRVPPHIGGKLYVDIDSRFLGEVGAEYHRPLYSKRMNKPWLRSAANHGTLQGRIHNDIHSFWHYSGSAPRFREVDGIPAPYFDGMDRMIGVIDAKGSAAAEGPVSGTLEAWIYSDAQSGDEVVLEWGGNFQLTTKHLQPGLAAATSGAAGAKPGWQHIGLVFQGDVETGAKPGEAPRVSGKTGIYLNGKKVGEQDGVLWADDGDYLHIGGHYDRQRWNWRRSFNGAVALLRWHARPLTAEQLSDNMRADFLSVPHDPVPQAFTTREGLILDLQAAALPEGKLAEWKNAGKAGGAFTAAKLGSMFAPRAETYLGRTGLRMAEGRPLHSSFDTPGCLKNGPFTIVYEVASTYHTGVRPILRWGKEPGHIAAVQFGTEGKAALAWGREPHRGREVTGAGLEYPYGNAKMACIWKTFAVTYENGTMKLYENGRLIQEKACTFEIAEPGAMTLGDGSGRTLLRELRVFDKALSAGDVKTLADGGQVAGDNLVVAINADRARDGEPVARLENTGRLKGYFGLPAEIDRSAEVKMLEGRKAVLFDGEAMLESDISLPDALTDDRPFTIEMWAYCEEDRDARLFAMNREVTRRHVSLGFGGRNAAALVTPGRARLDWTTRNDVTGRWTHLAWVYDGGARTDVRVYRDGKLDATRDFASLDTLGGYPMTLGGMMNPDQGAKYMFKGGIAVLKAYDYARTEQEIAQAAGAE